MGKIARAGRFISTDLGDPDGHLVCDLPLAVLLAEEDQSPSSAEHVAGVPT